MLKIRHAEISEKRKVYEWLCLSDTAPLHMGAPNYPESPIPTWTEYCRDFADFYFLPSEKDKGSVLVIESEGKEIGNMCYACFHLREGAAELDIWMNSLVNCGKGYGSAALKLLLEYLHKELRINSFIIRPSIKNARAIAAYKKAGFIQVDDDIKHLAVQSFLLPENLKEYGAGDYGVSETAVLVIEDYSK
jgi:diamine N-acetyltransferase